MDAVSTCTERREASAGLAASRKGGGRSQADAGASEAAGSSWPDLAESRVRQPLGMPFSGFQAQLARRVSRHALAHMPAGRTADNRSASGGLAARAAHQHGPAGGTWVLGCPDPLAHQCTAAQAARRLVPRPGLCPRQRLLCLEDATFVVVDFFLAFPAAQRQVGRGTRRGTLQQAAGLQGRRRLLQNHVRVALTARSAAVLLPQTHGCASFGGQGARPARELGSSEPPGRRRAPPTRASASHSRRSSMPAPPHTD